MHLPPVTVDTSPVTTTSLDPFLLLFVWFMSFVIAWGIGYTCCYYVHVLPHHRTPKE